VNLSQRVLARFKARVSAKWDPEWDAIAPEVIKAIKGWNLKPVKLVYRLLAWKQFVHQDTLESAIEALKPIAEESDDPGDKRNAAAAIKQLQRLVID
jgi:hypothetical protein